MSVVLVCFSGAPKVSPEAVKREAELDKYLENRVEGTKYSMMIQRDIADFTLMNTHTHARLRPLSVEILKKQNDDGAPDLVHVMRTLASESIPNLPPGGELASK